MTLIDPIPIVKRVRKAVERLTAVLVPVERIVHGQGQECVHLLLQWGIQIKGQNQQRGSACFFENSGTIARE